MSEPEWEPGEWAPANEVEHGMADALARGDGPAYARLLRSSQLLLPELPEPGSEAELDLAELLPPDAPFIPVFTSPESLVWAFGDLIEAYEELDLDALLQRWPDNQHQLAVNPGSPIGTFLPPHAVDDVAEGRQSLVRTEAVDQALADEALDQIQRICIAELAGRPAEAVAEVSTERRDDPPANRLEVALRQAVERSDTEAYLHALLAGDPVIVLTRSPVADPDEILDDGFPWRVLGGSQAAVIPVFSSGEMLARAGGRDELRLEVDFLHVLANWPDEEHLLYINPGSVLELILPGETVMDLVASMAEAMGGTE